MTISALGFWTAFEDFARKYCPRSSRPFAPSVCPPMEDPAKILPVGREEDERTQASALSDREAKRRKWWHTNLRLKAMDQQTQANQWPSPPQGGQHKWPAVQPSARSASPDPRPVQPSAWSASPLPQLDNAINQLKKMTAEQSEHRGALDVVINHLKEMKAEQDLQGGTILGIYGCVCQLQRDLQAIRKDVKEFMQPQGS